ncbi:MAG: single-stranded DNA-binding protein [Candidatus Paceibacterota bacterium]
MNLNKAYIIGRLTADPQLRSTKTGQSVASFSVATNRYWTKDGQRQEETEFHNIVVWGKQAETAAQYLKKGQEALVEGRIQTRNYEDQSGNKRYVTEIIADRVQFGAKAGGGSSGPSPSFSKPVASQENQSQEVKEEEIPTIDLDDEIKPEDLPF